MPLQWNPSRIDKSGRVGLDPNKWFPWCVIALWKTVPHGALQPERNIAVGVYRISLFHFMACQFSIQCHLGFGLTHGESTKSLWCRFEQTCNTSNQGKGEVEGRGRVERLIHYIQHFKWGVHLRILHLEVGRWHWNCLSLEMICST